LRDPAVAEHDVQMLLYTYSNLYDRVVDQTPLRFLPPLRRAILGRLLALQGYLHSDVSPRLELRLSRRAAGPHALAVEGRRADAATPTVRRVERRLWQLAPLLRAAPIPFMTRIAPPGKSFHGGGTFPMRPHPGPEQSDLLGRPMGLARVHVVDA